VLTSHPLNPRKRHTLVFGKAGAMTQYSVPLTPQISNIRRDRWLTKIAVNQYGAYHSNKVNIIIHMICVPLILFSAFEIVCSPFPERRSGS